MIVKIIRRWKRADYTVSEVWIDGEKQPYNALEDTDRGLYQAMSVADITAKKVYGKTAIPTGTYNCIYTWSSRFRRMLPLIENVRGFTGIRIHAGNTAKDTEGCILLGENKQRGMVLNSRATLEKFIAKLKTAWDIGESVTIKISVKGEE